ncbi:MAG TPA: PH domain-containing protein [Phycisphaerae bacterium]|nr:PH domain-containing protein [Phycisphaerae bacterium]
MVEQPLAEQERGPSGTGDPAGLAAADPPRMSGSAPDELQDEAARTRIISPSLLLPAEIVILELKPSRWLAVFASLPVAAIGLTLIVLVCAIDLPQRVREVGFIIGVWIIGLRLALALLQCLGRTYVLTDRRILVQSGVFNVVVEAMGLEEIENTFVAQAVGQRVVGIGTIFFRSDGAGRASLAWEHIRSPKKVHAHVVVQIDRWKNSLNGLKGQ